MKCKIILAGLISLLSFLVLSCNRPQVDDQILRVKEMIASGDIAVLELLEQMEAEYEQMSDLNKATFGRYWFQAHHNFIGKGGILDKPEYIDFSISYYIAQNDELPLGSSYYYKGSMYKHQRNYPEAGKCFLLAKDIFDKQNNYMRSAALCFDLGHLSALQKEFDKAIGYLHESLDYCDKAEAPHKKTASYFLLGWIFQETLQYEKAIECSRYAMEVIDSPELMGDLYLQMGVNFHLMDSPDSALLYIHKSLEFPSLDPNMSLRYVNLARVYKSVGEIDSAKYYANHSLDYDIDIYIMRDCYQLLYDISLEEGNVDQISYFVDRQRECEDSIKVIETQTKFDVVQKMHENEKETKRSRFHKIILALSVALLFLAVVGVYFKLSRSRKKVIEKADSYRSELSEKEHQSRISVIHNQIEKLQAKHSDLWKKANSQDRDNIERAIYNEVLSIEDEKTFLKKMNTYLDGFPDKLKDSFPQITYKEIVWCCLFILGLSTQEISTAMDFKLSTQYKFKQRLAKKLNFSSTKELEQSLREIEIG